MSSAYHVAFVRRVGTGVCKIPYLRFISADVHKYWFTASIIPYLCVAPCPVFRANPQPERESDIGSPVDRLPAPVIKWRLPHVYPSAAHVSRSPRLSASKFRALSEYERKAWGRGYIIGLQSRFLGIARPQNGAIKLVSSPAELSPLRKSK